MRTETVNINGNAFFVRLWGDKNKPKLLLLHGFPEYGGAWEELAAYLQNNYFCIAPDLRGYGQSYKPKGVDHYRTSLIAQDVVGLMQHYSPEQPIFLLGHDWGAGAAYVAAIAAPKLISKLVILNGVHPIPFQAELAKGGAQTAASQYINWLKRDDSADQLAAHDFEKLIGLLREKMDSSWFTPEKEAQYKAEWARDEAVETMVNWYKASPLKVPPLGQVLSPDELMQMDNEALRIHMPHLIVWGKNDVALTIESRNGIYELCNDVKIVELDDVDHWLHHQKPEQIAMEIAAFLKAD